VGDDYCYDTTQTLASPVRIPEIPNLQNIPHNIPEFISSPTHLITLPKPKIRIKKGHSFKIQKEKIKFIS